jgi:hypothetical protein
MLTALIRRLTGFEPATLVTSFHAEGYEAYGRRFVESFERFWPLNYALRVYAENVQVAPASRRVRVLDLLESVPELKSFRARHAGNPAASGRIGGGRYDYRYDALKFANKVFAVVHAARHCRDRLLVWLDADVVTLRPVPADFIQRLLREDCFAAYLGRFAHHSETGFLAFNLKAGGAKDFFAAYEAIYTSDELFRLREWHDCEVFDTVRATFSACGKIRTRDLSPEGTSHPFVNSVLGEYMDHLKGPERKRLGHTPPADYRYYRGVRLPPEPANFEAGRYAYLPRIVRLVKPALMVEVGTWSGHRAIQMARAALATREHVRYEGFDLFEDATPERDRAEMNVKPHYSQEQVEALLASFALRNPGFTFALTKGDSRDVLAELDADFAFIDGGHSVATIRSDFERLHRCRVIVLDDWYEGPIDVDRFGCNRVVESVPHWVLPGGDPVAGGGRTRLVVVAEATTLQELKAALSREQEGSAA